MSSRRKFLKNLTVATIGTTAISKLIAQTPSKVEFKQNPLPYPYNSLEKAMDGKTMEIHYTKHAAGYVKNLNKAIKELKITETDLVKLLQDYQKYPPVIRNNGGGHYNHEFFWQCLTPNFNLPSEEFLKAIMIEFGSFDDFKAQFIEAGKSVFGSGWVWLITNEKSKLEISTTSNQDNPIMINKAKVTPLLALDVWEHAYYLRYQNLRTDYLHQFWQVVNWNFVCKNYSNSFNC